MEVPRLLVKSELQLSDTTTATATSMVMRDWSYFCNLFSSLQQHWILNPLSKARDWTHILMDTSSVHNLLSHNGNSRVRLFSMVFDSLVILPLQSHWQQYVSLALTGPVKMQKKKREQKCVGEFFDSYCVVELWHGLLISHLSSQRISSRKWYHNMLPFCLNCSN